MLRFGVGTRICVEHGEKGDLQGAGTGDIVLEGHVVGYYADHFGCMRYVPFPITEGKYRLEDYDYTDYSNSGFVNRGHVHIVPKPDTDLNPYHDEPRFHSQEEYDDYIKWRD